MALKCKACGRRLDFLEILFGECDDCYKERHAKEEKAAELWRARRMQGQENGHPSEVMGEEVSTSKPKSETDTSDAAREASWIEVMLSVVWILCFVLALILGIMALVAANDRHDQGSAIVLTYAALSVLVSGVLFAALRKIISTLLSLNDSLKLLVDLRAQRAVQPKVEDAMATSTSSPES